MFLFIDFFWNPLELNNLESISLAAVDEITVLAIKLNNYHICFPIYLLHCSLLTPPLTGYL